MTDPTPLSPAAQAVLDASLAVYWRPVIDTPVFHNKSVAAALRAVTHEVAQIPVVVGEPLKGNIAKDLAVIHVADILAIAAELEGANG